MAPFNLSERLDTIDDLVQVFRDNDYETDMYDFPDEYTNWIEEQQAVRNSCTLVDQSFHMSPLYIEGPDAVTFFEDLGTNTFENFKMGSPPKAKNVVFCNPNGYMIRDVILFYIEEDTFISAGTEIPTNWQLYNLEANDYDVEYKVPYRPNQGKKPEEFRFQIQGPNAYEVIDQITDEGIPEISFFEMMEVQINGIDTFVLGFGMAEVAGVEIFGSFEHHDDIKETILGISEKFGIRQMGSKAYKTNKIGSGWIHQPVPAIYSSDRLEGYREWLGTDGPEARMSIGGSFEGNTIEDYYLTPYECGQKHLVDFDHDFVGSEALATMDREESRQKVTFRWDPDDVIDVYRSLFAKGETNKYINLPDTARQWSLTHYDRITKDGKTVGIAKYPGYLYYTREMLALGVIDPKYSEPGTEVTLVWGDRPSSKRKVEHHVQTEIECTVEPSPYIRSDRRE